MYHLLPTIVLIAISAGFYFLWRYNSPYPYTLNWDIWEHQTIVNAIRSGSSALLPSALSDTFQFVGYTTLFHSLIAGIQTLFNVHNLLGFWWVAEGVFFTLTTLAAYAFSYAVTKNRWAAVVGGILSACFFESSMAYTTLFLLPQTLAALVWVIGMTILAITHTHRTRIALMFSLIIIALHGIVGSLGALLLFIYAYVPRMKYHSALIMLAVGYAVPTLIAQFFPVGTLNSGEAENFTQTIGQKLTLFQQWYGFLPIPFLAIGIWKGQKHLLVLFAALIGIILSAFPYVLKFTIFTHYLMIAIMAVGIAWYFNQITSIAMKGLSVVIVTLAAGLIFVANVSAWQKPVMFRGITSQISIDEMKAAEILREKNINHDMFLISDPATQYIMEPLSGVNSQGGAYMNAATRARIIAALTSSDQKQFDQNISYIHDLLKPETTSKKILVVSGRTFKWLESPEDKRNSISYNIWRPEALSLENMITVDTWKEQFHLTEIYRNAGVVILATYDTK